MFVFAGFRVLSMLVYVAPSVNPESDKVGRMWDVHSVPWADGFCPRETHKQAG